MAACFILLFMTYITVFSSPSLCATDAFIQGRKFCGIHIQKLWNCQWFSSAWNGYSSFSTLLWNYVHRQPWYLFQNHVQEFLSDKYFKMLKLCIIIMPSDGASQRYCLTLLRLEHICFSNLHLNLSSITELKGYALDSFGVWLYSEPIFIILL